MEKHFAKVAFRQPISGLRGNKAAFDGALLHPIVVDSPTVIFHFDVNVVAAVVSAQHDIPRGRFSRGDTVGALLDAVRHGIAHQVHERVGNLLNDIVVELGLTSGKIQLHVLASRCRCIADSA